MQRGLQDRGAAQQLRFLDDERRGDRDDVTGGPALQKDRAEGERALDDGIRGGAVAELDAPA